MEEIKTKKCIKCSEEKPLTEFYHRTPKGKSRNGQSYPLSDCKECSKEYQRKRREENSVSYQRQKELGKQRYWEQRNLELPELMEKIGKIKICSKCGFEGSIEHFAKGNSVVGAINKNRLRGECKKCKNERMIQYRKDNPEMFSKINKNTYNRRKKDEEFQEYKKENSKEYNSRPEVKERTSKRHMARIKSNGSYHTRRLLSNTYNQIGGKRPPNQRTKKLIGYDGLTLLAHLGEKPKGKYDIDHIIPLSWFKQEIPPIISCDLRNLEWKQHNVNIRKCNYYADEVDTEYFKMVRDLIKEEYLYRFKEEGDKTIDTFKQKVLDLWEQDESCMILFE